MKSAVFYSSEDIRYEERKRPAIGDDEVLLKMRAWRVMRDGYL